MASDILSLIGTSTFPALIGMAIYSIKIKPGDQKLPKLMSGGLALFVQVWAVAFVTAFASSILFSTAGVSENNTSVFGQLIIPSITAFYYTKFRQRGFTP